VSTSALALELPPKGGYDSQLGGAYPPPAGVTSVSRDRLAKPVPGIYSICYLNIFQTQAEESDWWKRNNADLLLTRADGTFVEDQNWPGELFLDTSTPARRDAIFAIQSTWVKQCADDGFKAIELDNLDSWTRSDGALTLANNLGLARLLSDLAHDLGLAVAQKNNPELGSAGKVLGGFDFAIAKSARPTTNAMPTPPSMARWSWRSNTPTSIRKRSRGLALGAAARSRSCCATAI
jgi:hypothetical protein